MSTTAFAWDKWIRVELGKANEKNNGAMRERGPKICGLFVQQNQIQVGLKYQTSQLSQYCRQTQLCSHGDILISHSRLGQQ